MITFLSIFLLQLAFTYKILFVPRTYRHRLYTDKKNEINIDYNSSLHAIHKNITTNAQIHAFIENIKKKETTNDYDFLKEKWDDGEVEW